MLALFLCIFSYFIFERIYMVIEENWLGLLKEGKVVNFLIEILIVK